jgi:hypothetical protein
VLLAGVLLAACARRAEPPPTAPQPPVAAASASPASPASPAPPPGAPEGAAAGERAVLFLAADVRGYLAPCGCSENMRGGIARAAHVLAEARGRGGAVLFVDGGNSLFGAPTLAPAQVPQEEARARALAGALRQMGLAARATGPLDAARGEAFLAGLGLPALAPGEGRALDAGAHRVGVAAGRTSAQLAAGAAAARQAGAHFVVGLVPLTLEQAQPLAATREAAGGVDLLLASGGGEPGAEENRLVRGAVPLAAPQSKGRSLLRVDVALGGAGARGGAAPGPFGLQRGQADLERELEAVDARLALLAREVDQPGVSPALKALKQGKLEELVARRARLASAEVPGLQPGRFTLRFVALEASLPADPAVARQVAAYDAEVGRLNLSWAAAQGEDCPAPERGAAAHVGSAACRSCHPDAFPVWEASKHAHAWETLEAVGKQHHLNCAGCHVTGWAQPGGVCRIDRTAGREDVGCESCHGPGSRHVTAPSAETIVGRPGEQACVGCHNPENSPHFDFATYVPRILGPGHGGARSGAR